MSSTVLVTFDALSHASSNSHDDCALENDISFYRCKKTLKRCEVIQFTQVLSDTEFEARLT